MRRPKLLFFITEDWYFLSHRLPIALAAQDAGFDVAVITKVSKENNAVNNAGIKIIPFNISRRNMNPLLEIVTLFKLSLLYRKEKPDIVHHVAMKPVLYGTIAARLAGVSNVVNALAGLGYIFTSNQKRAHLLRLCISNAFKALLNRTNSRLILQNQDDCEMFIQKKLINKNRLRLIRGSGVNTSIFSQRPEPTGIPVVTLASRMLLDKGIMKFVEAARKLKNTAVSAHFVLAGDTDMHNPSGISKEQLLAWHDEGIVEWLGHRDNMHGILSQSNIVCLPSYREGLPKVLLEAASCGRAIVATDVPGCREIVRHNENGLLVPPNNSESLANAIRTLIENPGLRAKMGARGREIVEAEFSQEMAIRETLAIYKEMIENKI